MTIHASSQMDRRTMLRGSITLAGAVVVLPGMASLAGCAAAPATLEPHRALVAAIADAVIPATDTPGALIAGVPDYVAAVFEQHLTADQQREFVDGLAAIDASAQKLLGTSLADAGADDRAAALSALASSDEAAPAKAAWRQLRDLVIFGFYTSETATQELPYEELPGRYSGCVPLAEIGGAWLERGV